MNNNSFPRQSNRMGGINNNNFNRQRFPSNEYLPNGGMPGNPFGRYNPVSTNSFKNNNFSNFSTAYNSNRSIIEPYDYRNTGRMLHNNVGEDVLDEHIVEYRINIDSLDRDIKTYPDPFSFRVQFDAPSSGYVRTESLKNGELITTNDYFNGAPGPKINRKFRNVKYIKLDSVVLPQYSQTKENISGEIVFDKDSYLLDDRFVMLEIDELNDSKRVYSTSDAGMRVNPDNGNIIKVPRPFGTIYPDTKLGDVYYIGTPYNSNKIYNSADLGNINKLTIKFYDSCGRPLKYNELFTIKDLECAANHCDPLDIKDLRHPLNKKIQVYMTFIIGVVESQINNNTKFER